MKKLSAHDQQLLRSSDKSAIARATGLTHEFLMRAALGFAISTSAHDKITWHLAGKTEIAVFEVHGGYKLHVYRARTQTDGDHLRIELSNGGAVRHWAILQPKRAADELMDKQDSLTLEDVA